MASFDPLAQRARVLLTLYDEKQRPDPSEAVVVACEIALRLMPAPPDYAKLRAGDKD